MRLFWVLVLIVSVTLTLFTGCDDVHVAQHNITKAADNFEVMRRIVFYNGITDNYILVIEGYSSINDNGMGQLEVIVKTGPESFKKHFLGLSDNVTYFAEQLESAEVGDDHYRVTFKPKSIIPDIDIKN